MTEQIETTDRRTDQINLSAVAAGKVKSLLEQEGRDDLALRISVQPGGCSGLRYQLFFDERTLDGDVRRRSRPAGHEVPGYPGTPAGTWKIRATR